MPRLSSLQNVLGLRFIVAATLPLLLFGWFAYHYLAKRQLEVARSELRSHAVDIRDEVSGFFEQVESNLLLIRSSVELLQSAAPDQIGPQLQAAASQSSYFEAIYLLDENLRVRSLGLPANLAAQRQDYLHLDFSGLELLSGRNHSHAAKVLAGSREIAISDSFVSVATGQPALMIMAKTRAGYLLGTIRLARLADYLHRRNNQSDKMVFAVIDHHGTLIAHTDQHLALERTNYLLHPEVQSALVSGEEVDASFHEDLSLLESVRVIPKSGWVVHASVPREVVMLSADRLRMVLVSTLVIAAVLGGGLAFWQSRRVVRPLLKLRDGTQGVTRGDYRGLEQLGKTGYAELDELSANFLEMGGAVMERETYLRASEERYRSLLAGMGEGLLIFDRSGRITDCNEVAERIFAIPRRELVGSNLLTHNWRTIHEDGTEFPAGEFPAHITLQAGIDVNNQLIGVCLPDGREVWLQVNSRPQWALSGEIVAAVVTFADVTRLKVAEASLRFGKLRYQELFQQFSALLDGITDRIDLLTPDLRVVWTNRRDFDSQNADAGQVAGSCCFAHRFGRSEPCPDCPVVRCFATGRREVGEIVDQQGLVWSLRAFPVKSEHATTQVVLIAEDITEKLEGEKQRSRASQLAALGELAAGVAHEINNPISGVINYAQLILNRSGEDSRERDLAQRIIKEGNRIATIVRELLTFAREESSEMQVVSVREALAEALSLCESQLRKEAVDLRIDLPADLPGVESRSHQIQQLFLNLISNSRHALGEKYPEPHADKLLQVSGCLIERDGSPYVRLKVRDHGVGIPSPLLERVMNPFVTTKPAGVGTGLGLSISFEIAKKHGGTLAIASEHGAWTEVTVELPACRATAVQG